jgi:hypothetical protein
MQPRAPDGHEQDHFMLAIPGDAPNNLSRKIRERHQLLPHKTGEETFRITQGQNTICAPRAAVVTLLDGRGPDFGVQLTLSWPDGSYKSRGDFCLREFWLFGCNARISQQLFDQLEYVGACNIYLPVKGDWSGRCELFERSACDTNQMMAGKL